MYCPRLLVVVRLAVIVLIVFVSAVISCDIVWISRRGDTRSASQICASLCSFDHGVVLRLRSRAYYQGETKCLHRLKF